MKVIINGKIIKANEILKEHVIIFDDKIIDVIHKDKMDEFLKVNPNVEIIDAKDNYVSPGFIDLHIHGSGGADVMDGEVSAIELISETIAKNGVTSFLPTTMTMGKDKIHKALEVIRECKNNNLNGAKVLGAHLEGPFINSKYKGAQSPEYIISPDYEFIKDYIDVIKMITVAPEVDEKLKFIKKVKDESDIVLSIGHTNATYEEAMEAIEAGVSHITHTFNAMTPLNHRKPGVVGAAFSSDVYCELIADKIHVHQGIFNIMVKVKGKDKIILVTDSIRAGCLKCGISELGGQKVIVDETTARLEDGTLAGSILTLNKAIKNFYENTKLLLQDVIGLASWNAAKDIGVIDERGTLDIGKYSDIVIFDEDFNIQYTIVEGNIVFRKGGN